MAKIEQRLKVLEGKSTDNKEDVTNIMVVAFVNKGEVDSPITHIYHGDLNFYKAQDETDNDFTNRASAEIRKVKQIKANNALLLFGDRTIETIST